MDERLPFPDHFTEGQRKLARASLRAVENGGVLGSQEREDTIQRLWNSAMHCRLAGNHSSAEALNWGARYAEGLS